MKLTETQNLDLGITPPPGIYLGVPFHLYKLWRYPSKSLLGSMEISPAQFAAQVRGDIAWKTSDSFTVGSLTDQIWVEKQLIDEQHGWIEAPAGMPKSGAKRAAWLASLPAGLEPYTAEQLSRAQAMAATLGSHERACELRAGATPQVSLVWDCPHTGIRLKGRPDLVDFDRLILCDLKTARDIRRGPFAKACADYDYHWQLHLYTQALSELGAGDYYDWKQWLIAVRNEPVHGVACRPMGADALELASDETADLLWRMRACIDAGAWPADQLDESAISLPGWRYNYRPAVR